MSGDAFRTSPKPTPSPSPSSAPTPEPYGYGFYEEIPRELEAAKERAAEEPLLKNAARGGEGVVAHQALSERKAPFEFVGSARDEMLHPSGFVVPSSHLLRQPPPFILAKRSDIRPDDSELAHRAISRRMGAFAALKERAAGNGGAECGREEADGVAGDRRP